MSILSENPEIATRVIAALLQRLGATQVTITEAEMNAVPPLASRRSPRATPDDDGFVDLALVAQTKN